MLSLSDRGLNQSIVSGLCAESISPQAVTGCDMAILGECYCADSYPRLPRKYNRKECDLPCRSVEQQVTSVVVWSVALPWTSIAGQIPLALNLRPGKYLI